MAAPDPYNKDEVISACAKHAWGERKGELRNHGLNNEAEVRAHISKTIEGQDTHAFVCQPQPERQQTFQREIYNAPFESPGGSKPYETTVILNPGRDEQGQVFGGTCMIRGKEKSEFHRIYRREHEQSGFPPPVIDCGRPALREQQQHQPERPKLSFYEDDQQPKHEHEHQIKL